MPPDLASLFQPPFYFEIWTRDREVLGSSPETPSGVLMPGRSGEGAIPRNRARLPGLTGPGGPHMAAVIN